MRIGDVDFADGDAGDKDMDAFACVKRPSGDISGGFLVYEIPRAVYTV
jgi:hypothetical protein